VDLVPASTYGTGGFTPYPLSVPRQAPTLLTLSSKKSKQKKAAEGNAFSNRQYGQLCPYCPVVPKKKWKIQKLEKCL
jgi:hypothetical protein